MEQRNKCFLVHKLVIRVIIIFTHYKHMAGTIAAHMSSKTVLKPGKPGNYNRMHIPFGFPAAEVAEKISTGIIKPLYVIYPELAKRFECLHPPNQSNCISLFYVAMPH